MGRLKVLVGKRVKEIRKRKGLTQQALAEKTNLSLNMIGYIERGVKFPSAETFEKLTSAFRVKVQDFFRPNPKDDAENPQKTALDDLESLLVKETPDFIRMVERMVREIKRNATAHR